MNVLFFDYWTKGIHHFQSVDKILKENGHTTRLFHLGSLRLPCPKEEVLYGIECRDISFYRTRLVFKILKQERPDVVLTLNARTLFDRALILACRKLNIRTVFLTHGIVTSLENPEGSVKDYEKTMNNLRFMIPRAGKYLKFILPNYFFSIWKSTGSLKSLWRGFNVAMAYAKNPGRTVIELPAIDEVVHDSHLLFSAHGAEAFRKQGYPKDRVFAIGNPKYDDLLVRLKQSSLDVSDLPDPVQKLVAAKRPYALVLEDAFPESIRMGGWTPEYRTLWLKQMALDLKKQGFELVVKLHPSTIRSSIKLDPNLALIFQDADLDALIYFSAFCIAHISTTVENCVLLGKPVVTPRWGLSKNIFDYFVRLGVSRPWNSSAEKPDLEIDQTARSRYRTERITVLEPVATRNVLEHLTRRLG